MTPVASWSPADYFAASRAAQRAWEATSPQLTLPSFWDALDDPSHPAFRRMGQGGGIVERVPLEAGGVVDGNPLGGAHEVTRPGVPPAHTAPTTTTEAVANLIREKRDRLQKGA